MMMLMSPQALKLFPVHSAIILTQHCVHPLCEVYKTTPDVRTLDGTHLPSPLHTKRLKPAVLECANSKMTDTTSKLRFITWSAPKHYI